MVMEILRDYGIYKQKFVVNYRILYDKRNELFLVQRTILMMFQLPLASVDDDPSSR